MKIDERKIRFSQSFSYIIVKIIETHNVDQCNGCDSIFISMFQPAKNENSWNLQRCRRGDVVLCVCLSQKWNIQANNPSLEVHVSVWFVSINKMVMQIEQCANVHSKVVAKIGVFSDFINVSACLVWRNSYVKYTKVILSNQVWIGRKMHDQPLSPRVVEESYIGLASTFQITHFCGHPAVRV